MLELFIFEGSCCNKQPFKRGNDQILISTRDKIEVELPGQLNLFRIRRFLRGCRSGNSPFREMLRNVVITLRTAACTKVAESMTGVLQVWQCRHALQGPHGHDYNYTMISDICNTCHFLQFTDVESKNQSLI